MTITTSATILRAADVEARPWEPLGRLEGVRHKVVWRDDTSIAGVMQVEGGHRLGLHTHRVNHHHIWIIDGRAVVLGHELEPGSYVHIPAGIEHDVDATATDGCTFLYLYLRPAEDASRAS